MILEEASEVSIRSFLLFDISLLVHVLWSLRCINTRIGRRGSRIFLPPVLRLHVQVLLSQCHNTHHNIATRRTSPTVNRPHSSSSKSQRSASRNASRLWLAQAQLRAVSSAARHFSEPQPFTPTHPPPLRSLPKSRSMGACDLTPSPVYHSLLVQSGYLALSAMQGEWTAAPKGQLKFLFTPRAVSTGLPLIY